MTGQFVAVKIMEAIGDNIEEIEEEYLILRDLCLHPNIPSFYGLYLKRGKRREEDQLWFCMEVPFRTWSSFHLVYLIHYQPINSCVVPVPSPI